MSNARPSSSRLFIRGGLTLLVLCAIVVGAWSMKWLPTGMQETLDRFAAKMRPAPSVASSDPEAQAAAKRLTNQELAEQEMREAGEQFEPNVPAGAEAAADESAAPLNQAEPQPFNEAESEMTPLADASAKTNELSAEPQPVRQTRANDADDPFAEVPNTVRPNPSSRVVANAGFEEDLAPNPKPTATEKPAPVKPITVKPVPPKPLAKPATLAPPPQNDPGAQGVSSNPPPVSQPGRNPVEPEPISPTDDRTASRGSDSTATGSAPLMDRKLINDLVEANDFVSAQRELSRWYWKKPASRGQIRKQLDDLAQSLYFSPQPPYQEPYVVQPGDQLRVIAQRYKLSWEYISKLNLVDARKIRMGQKLKVVDGPFAAIVSLSSYELIVHLNGSFVRSYRVGVGKEGTTPLGTFTVKNKLVDPTYYGPDGLVMAHDDPQNPLGERWIDIGDGFGIHGTIEPDSIGKNASRGCIRMLSKDVEEVYDLLVIGSQVKIQK